MLGAQSSGKTTFLAALSLAVTWREGQNPWNVVGADTASTQALVDLTLALNDERTFPAPTALAIESYRWLLMGKARQYVKRRWFGVKEVLENVRISLNLADASGELSSRQHSNHPAREDLISSIEQSGGIVFIFDPVSEAKEGNSYKHLFNVLAELAGRMVDKPEFADGKLSHHVAVCISKFDDLKVLTTAEKLQMIVSDPRDRYGFPRIHEDDARDFFMQLCHVLNAGDAELVMRTLEQNFKPDRIKYYVTSSIGFYVNPETNLYDSEDPQNHLLEVGDGPHKARIRGTIHPINVVEPLMWLAGKLTGKEPL
jgi:hypothetical protein